MCEDYLKKVKELEGSIKLMDGRCKSNYDSLLTKYEKQQDDIFVNKNDFNRIELNLQEFKFQTEKYDDKILQSKNEVIDQISEKDKQTVEMITEVRALIQNIESRGVEHHSRLDNNKHNLDEIQGDVEKMQANILSLKKESNDLYLSKIDKKEFRKFKTTMKDDLSKVALSHETTK